MSTSGSQSGFSRLKRRLAESGFPPGYVKKAMPEWWSNGLWETDSGFAQGAIILSRKLGLDLESIHEPCATICLQTGTSPKFKLRKSSKESELAIAQAVSLGAARTAVGCARGEYKGIPQSASDIRAELIERRDHQSVALGNLLDYCWERGVPVLHVSCFPRGGKKPDGMAAMVEGRPVLIISRKQKFAAWQVFILAHELGHICRGHVSENSTLVDESISVEDRDSNDEEEQANRFAKELLLGGGDLNYSSPRRLNAVDLADAAIRRGRESGSDPGVIALNYAYNQDFIPVGMKALGLLEPEADAVSLINEKMLQHLDRDMIPQDSFEWLLHVTAAKQSP